MRQVLQKVLDKVNLFEHNPKICDGRLDWASYRSSFLIWSHIQSRQSFLKLQRYIFLPNGHWFPPNCPSSSLVISLHHWLEDSYFRRVRAYSYGHRDERIQRAQKEEQEAESEMEFLLWGPKIERCDGHSLLVHLHHEENNFCGHSILPGWLHFRSNHA